MRACLPATFSTNVIYSESSPGCIPHPSVVVPYLRAAVAPDKMIAKPPPPPPRRQPRDIAVSVRKHWYTWKVRHMYHCGTTQTPGEEDTLSKLHAPASMASDDENPSFVEGPSFELF